MLAAGIDSRLSSTTLEHLCALHADPDLQRVLMGVSPDMFYGCLLEIAQFSLQRLKRMCAGIQLSVHS